MGVTQLKILDTEGNGYVPEQGSSDDRSPLPKGIEADKRNGYKGNPRLENLPETNDSQRLQAHSYQ